MDVEASLEAAIDPALDLTSVVPSPVPSIPPQQGTTPNPDPSPVHTATSDSLQIPNPATPSPNPKKKENGKQEGPKKKKNGIIPNSAADFRRRESNRLAAERSRSRTNEKNSILYQNHKSLTEENEKLKQQIQELENGLTDQTQTQDEVLAPDSQVSLDDVIESANNKDANQDVQREAQEPFHPHSEEVSMEHHGLEEGNHTSTTQEQDQEAHSNTILAALTDITGVDFSENNDANWMQGMESLLKDSEASGRLAELAVVATTGHEESNEESTQQQSLQGSHDHSSSTQENGSQNSGHIQVESHEIKGQQHLIPSPANNPVIALAAAINTEIERIILEDLADTKAAIATIEKQIESMKDNNQSTPTEIEEDDIVNSTLPESLLIDDIGRLSILSTEIEFEITNIQNTLPQLHKDLVNLRDEKTVEEKKVIELAKVIKDFSFSSEEEKNNFISSLKAFGGVVETILSGGLNRDLSYASGSYSTPAIARRRRGRPPKGDVSRAIYQSFLLSPPPLTKHDQSSENEPKSKTKSQSRPQRKARKSRLSKQINLSDEEEKQEDVEENLRQIQASAQAQEQEQEQEQAVQASEERQSSQVTPAQQEQNEMPNDQIEPQGDSNAQHQPGDIELELNTVDQEATAEAVNRAEAFILSQLASQDHSDSQSNNQHEHDHERDDLNLNQSTSFADFLPAQEELERQANQRNQQDHDISGIEQQLNQIQQQQQQQPHSQGQTPSNSNMNSSSIVAQPSDSALARLKKGPPGSCDICMRTETTVWRKLSLGNQDLKVCNPCGVYHKKFGVIRPPELWDDGNTIRRRRTGPRTPSRPENGDEGLTTDGERPTKRAKKAGSSLKQAIGTKFDNSTSINVDASANDSQGELTLQQQQQEEESRRLALNVALMEGITAISAVPSEQVEEVFNNSNGEGMMLDQHGQVSDFEEANQEGKSHVQIEQGLEGMDDSQHHQHHQSGDDISSVFGM